MEEKLEDVARRAANERARLQDEITQLKEFLGAAKASKKLINDELGNVRLEAEASARQVQSLQANVQALEQDKVDVSESTTAYYLLISRPYSSKKLYRPLVPRRLICFGKARGILWERVPLDRARMITSVTKLLVSSMFYPFHRLLLRGFVRHIVQELQKENSAHVSKIKSLENENKLLRSEAEELKEVRNPDILQRRCQLSKKAVKSLESTLEESIAREEQALQREEAPIDPANADAAGLQHALRESQVKYEVGSTGHCGIKPCAHQCSGRTRKIAQENVRGRTKE